MKSEHQNPNPDVVFTAKEDSFSEKYDTSLKEHSVTVVFEIKCKGDGCPQHLEDACTAAQSCRQS